MKNSTLITVLSVIFVSMFLIWGNLLSAQSNDDAVYQTTDSVFDKKNSDATHGEAIESAEKDTNLTGYERDVNEAHEKAVASEGLQVPSDEESGVPSE